MSESNAQTAEQLTRLIARQQDVLDGHRAAHGQLESGKCRETMELLRQERQRQRDELAATLVDQIDHEAPDVGRWRPRRWLHRLAVELRSVRGDRSVMSGSRAQLDRLLERYEEALDIEVPKPVERVLQRHWLALLRQSAWVDVRIRALDEAGETPSSRPPSG